MLVSLRVACFKLKDALVDHRSIKKIVHAIGPFTNSIDPFNFAIIIWLCCYFITKVHQYDHTGTFLPVVKGVTIMVKH